MNHTSARTDIVTVITVCVSILLTVSSCTIDIVDGKIKKAIVYRSTILSVGEGESLFTVRGLENPSDIRFVLSRSDARELIGGGYVEGLDIVERDGVAYIAVASGVIAVDVSGERPRVVGAIEMDGYVDVIMHTSPWIIAAEYSKENGPRIVFLSVNEDKTIDISGVRNIIPSNERRDQISDLVVVGEYIYASTNNGLIVRTSRDSNDDRSSDIIFDGDTRVMSMNTIDGKLIISKESGELVYIDLADNKTNAKTILTRKKLITQIVVDRKHMAIIYFRNGCEFINDDGDSTINTPQEIDNRRIIGVSIIDDKVVVIINDIDDEIRVGHLEYAEKPTG